VRVALIIAIAVCGCCTPAEEFVCEIDNLDVHVTEEMWQNPQLQYSYACFRRPA